jgi:hypothetical protein
MRTRSKVLASALALFAAFSSKSSQSRVAARACTDVPFLVPGNCTGNHYLTNSY